MTRPIVKKNVTTGVDTQIVGVVEAGYLQATYEFFDGRRKILGREDGDHNHTKVEVKPVYIGWTHDAGKTFISDDDLIRAHGKTTVGRALRAEGYVPPKLMV